jgi:O-antigen ligase
MITWILAAMVVVIPLGTRLFVYSVIPGFHEYEALFVYASDFFVLLLLAVSWRIHGQEIRTRLHSHGGPLLVALIIAGLASIVTAPSGWLGAYTMLRLVLLIALAFSIGVITSNKKVLQIILAVIAIVALVEAGIGLSQFKVQGSVGLARFGEAQLLTVAGSTSTIAAEGGRLLRIYGTFPHPNIFAAFLLLGALSLAYWYLWCEQELRRELFDHPHSWWNLKRGVATLKRYVAHRYFYLRLGTAAAMFILLLALALTFSRAGWIAGALSFAVLMMLSFQKQKGGTVRLFLMVAACTAAVYLLFASALSPRAELSIGQPAVDMRLKYADIGLQIISDSIGGVGIGNQVLYGVQDGLYKAEGLKHIWDIEPIHNLYLLVAAEMGWLGLLSFLAFLGMVTWRLLRGHPSLEVACILGMVAAIMVLGLFDHYLWDLQSGRLMLWLVVGLALSQLPPPTRRSSR